MFMTSGKHCNYINFVCVGYLALVDVTSASYSTLPRRDNAMSGSISTGGDFKFGTDTINSVYVC